jgi:hypothetical protein
MTTICIVVIIRAMRLLAFSALSATMHFIVKRMVFLLLPAMTELTTILIWATVRIRLNKIFGLPLRALFALVFVKMRLSSEILPIVSIDASITGMCSI